jgi:hypothetical protein
MKPKILSATIAISLATGACYKQLPLETLPPPPATHIVAELTDSGTVALSNAIGPGALAVEGVINNADQSTWVLQMLRVDHRDGRSVNWNRELVSFAPSLLNRPNVKVLDKRRSWLAGAGITIGAFILARSFNLFGADDSEEEVPQPQQSVSPGGGR